MPVAEFPFGRAGYYTPARKSHRPTKMHYRCISEFALAQRDQNFYAQKQVYRLPAFVLEQTLASCELLKKG